MVNFHKYIRWKIWWNVKKIGQNQNAPFRFFLLCETAAKYSVVETIGNTTLLFLKKRCINSTGRTFHLVSFSRRKVSWFFLLVLTFCDRFLHTYFFFFTPLCWWKCVENHRTAIMCQPMKWIIDFIHTESDIR